MRSILTSSRGPNGANGTKNLSFNVQEIDDFKGPTVRELRKSTVGRAQLAESGRDPWFSTNHPTASMDREFISWDMEGITYVPDTPQSPVLFGASTGDTVKSSCLSTREMFSCLLRVERCNPSAYHVGYGFTYDVNQMLCDLPGTALRILKDTNNVTWDGYRIQYMPKKWFRVSIGKGSDKVVAQIWDIFTFFGTSFVNACRKMLGCHNAHTRHMPCGNAVCAQLDPIEADKEKRGSFKFEQLDSLVIPYWRSELVYLVKLAEALRENLYNAGYRITRWYGPGSATSYVLKERNISQFMASPEYVAARINGIPDSSGDNAVRGIVHGAKLLGLENDPRGSGRNGSLSPSVPAPIVSGRTTDKGRASRARGRTHPGIVPDAVNDAAQYAYAGGRFELFKCGRYLGKVWQYDLNSAYPWAIAQLPSLAHGKWRQVTEFDPHREFAVYRIRCTLPYRTNVPYPFYFRDKRHCIYYPPVVEGWYWAPEVRHMEGLPGFDVIDGWVFEPATDEKPFAWVNDAYDQRLLWKEQGNPSEYSIKILLNSLYGKMAQRVGYNKELLLPPKWHQLEWAGWVTSKARATLYSAMLRAGNALLSVETDAVFTTRPIDLDTGKGLGQWGVDEFDEVIYIQSGFRFYRTGDEWHSKYRGLDPNSISLDSVRETLQNSDFTKPVYINGTTTRFVQMASGLQRGLDRWRVWEENQPRSVLIGSDGKRVHVPELCAECQVGHTAWEGLHTLSPSVPRDTVQTPHGIPWKECLDEWQLQWDNMLDSA
jgi:hypothetical protein